jgi:hypothetical protein
MERTTIATYCKRSYLTDSLHPNDEGETPQKKKVFFVPVINTQDFKIKILATFFGAFWSSLTFNV